MLRGCDYRHAHCVSHSMRFFTVSLLTAGLCAFVLTQTPGAQTQSGVVWQTTFNCGDWNQAMGLADTDVCGASDGIRGHGAWATAGHPSGDEITTAANYAGGGGSHGFRHWRGDGFDNNGGGIKIGLPAGYAELYIRFYMRYQAGFKWSGGNPDFTKELYALGNTAPDWTFGFHGGNGIWGWTNGGSADTGTLGWSSIMNGPASDGNWHCYEYHIKRGTTTSNGVKEYWVDNTRGLSMTNVDSGTTGTWNSFVIGSNQNAPLNGTEMYTDYDDFAVATSGRVGCSGTPLQRPAAPTNVHVVR